MNPSIATKRALLIVAIVASSGGTPLHASTFDYVEATERAMVIDATSFVEGFRQSFFPPGLDTWMLNISGTFTLRVTDYFFGCSATPFGNICADTFSTIQLRDPEIVVDTTPERAFNFPVYRATFNSPPLFSGNNGPCAVTLPGEHCTGISNGPLSTFQGSFDGTSLMVTGTDPAASPFGGVGYTYSISAIPTPLPAALWMLAPPLASLALTRRRAPVRV